MVWENTPVDFCSHQLEEQYLYSNAPKLGNIRCYPKLFGGFNPTIENIGQKLEIFSKGEISKKIY